MRKNIFQWLGREFVALSCEGKAGLTPTEEAQEIFSRFDEELRAMGLSLENTVRTRLWGRDRESRNLGSNERVKVLSGKARSASSSYIAPRHFDSGACVALDLLAMSPSRRGDEKTLKEYDRPSFPSGISSTTPLFFFPESRPSSQPSVISWLISSPASQVLSMTPGAPGIKRSRSLSSSTGARS